MPENQEAKSNYVNAVREASAVIYRIDPAGIAYESDEYDPEAARVVAGARSTASIEELRDLVTSVFDKMFWPGVCSAEKATEIAEAVWPIVRRLHAKP